MLFNYINTKLLLDSTLAQRSKQIACCSSHTCCSRSNRVFVLATIKVFVTSGIGRRRVDLGGRWRHRSRCYYCWRCRCRDNSTRLAPLTNKCVVARSGSTLHAPSVLWSESVPQYCGVIDWLDYEVSSGISVQFGFFASY
jgi:hypothetical protein